MVALGRVPHRQKTPCTRQAWSWVTFSRRNKAEERVVLALVPTGLGTAWSPWSDANHSVTPNGAWAYVVGDRNYAHQCVRLQRLPTGGELTSDRRCFCGGTDTVHFHRLLGFFSTLGRNKKPNNRFFPDFILRLMWVERPQ